MTSVYVAPVPVQPFASVAVTSIGNEPVCVGVPERTPFEPSVSPAGSVLAVVNVVVPIAFVAVNVSLNGALTVPVVVLGLTTPMTWQATNMSYGVAVPVQPFESVTVTVMTKPPVCSGVPERTPFEARVRPTGSVL